MQRSWDCDCGRRGGLGPRFPEEIMGFALPPRFHLPRPAHGAIMPLCPSGTILPTRSFLMRSISVGPYSFTLSEPYSAGHPLTEGEARALNALRAENIRNSLRRWIELEEKLSVGQLSSRVLLPEQITRLQQKLARYDESYAFGTPSRVEPRGLAEMLRLVAEEFLAEELRRQGQSLESLVNRRELLEELAASEAVQQEARHRLAAAQRVATSVLDELGAL